MIYLDWNTFIHKHNVLCCHYGSIKEGEGRGRGDIILWDDHFWRKTGKAHEEGKDVDGCYHLSNNIQVIDSFSWGKGKRYWYDGEVVCWGEIPILDRYGEIFCTKTKKNFNRVEPWGAANRVMNKKNIKSVKQKHRHNVNIHIKHRKYCSWTFIMFMGSRKNGFNILPAGIQLDIVEIEGQK